MTHSPATVLVRFLRAQNIVTLPAGVFPGFVAFMPDVPDNAVCLYDEEGQKDGRLMRTGEVIEHPRVMVHIRSKDYETGWAKADAIRAAFDSVQRDNISVDATIYRIDNISRTSTILALGLEDGTKRRQFFSLNVLATIKQQ